MWKNIIERGRPQTSIWLMRVTCWMPKATNSHTCCVILTAFPLQKWLHERASMLRYTYIDCLVFIQGLHMKGVIALSFELDETARDCCLS